MCQGSLGFCLNVSQNTLAGLLSSHRSLELNCNFHIYARQRENKWGYIISLKKNTWVSLIPLSLVSEILWIWKIMKTVIIPRKIRINTTGQGPLRSVSVTCCCAPAKAFHLMSAAGRVLLRRMRLHFFRSLMGIKRSQVLIHTVSVICFMI